jgi:hypothetical protein
LREVERGRTRDVHEGGNGEGEGGRDCRRRRESNSERDDERGMKSGIGRVSEERGGREGEDE